MWGISEEAGSGGAVVVRPVRLVSVAYTRFVMTSMTAHGYRSNPEKAAIRDFFDSDAEDKVCEANESDELEYST
jgi:hypothetical protein